MIHITIPGNPIPQSRPRFGNGHAYDTDKCRAYKYGVYAGEEIPPDGFLHDIGTKNPKIVLDSGDVVWGYQCWWGDENTVKKQLGDRQVIIVDLDGEPKEA